MEVGFIKPNLWMKGFGVALASDAKMCAEATELLGSEHQLV